MPTSKNINNLIINKVESQAVYDSIRNRDLLNDDELYLILGEINTSIDASSITGLDTYLSDKYYVKKISGSYSGNGYPNKITSISALKTNGRPISVSSTSEPLFITLNDKILGQKEAFIVTDDTFGGTYYTAYLEGCTLYVARGHAANNGHNVSGTTYKWNAFIY